MASKARGLADLGNVYSDGALSNRNVIINGGMKVGQRDAGAAVTAGSSVVYAVDRMKAQNTTATGTITSQQSTLGNSKSLKITATAAVTDLTASLFTLGLQTVPEAQDIYHMNGQAVTVSFVVETNWTGNLPVCVRNHDGTRSYVVDAAVVSGVNNVSVSLTLEAATVDALDTGRGMDITIGFNNEATLQTATTGSWVAGAFLCSTASTQWTKTISNFINVTNFQLELGDTATPFEHRSYGDELARCQRYHYIPPQGPLHIVASGKGIFNISPPVAFRAAPTASIGRTNPYVENVPWGSVGTVTGIGLNSGHLNTHGGDLLLAGTYVQAHSYGDIWLLGPNELSLDAEL